MRTVWPHEFFRLEFDQILEEGRHQEAVHPANTGEYALVRQMHAYLADEALPLILGNNRVFEAAFRFASEDAADCFHSLRLTGVEVFKAQQTKLAIDRQVVEFLGQAIRMGRASPRQHDLAKASDFYPLLHLDRLPNAIRAQAERLRARASDHEALQLRVTLRAIRDLYEVVLPRIMYVVRCALRVRLAQQPAESDNELRGMSESLTWYEAHIESGHALFPVLGYLRTFYKIARNVASHHQGFKWEPATNEVILTDSNDNLRIPVVEFQQRYRHLVYLCDLGQRGILAAFCEREQGPIANGLVKEYIKTFPDDFPQGEEGRLRLYPV